MTDKRIFYDTAEVADRWRLSRRTLEGRRDKGVGPGYTLIGSRVRYHIDEIEKFERAWSGPTNVLPWIT